VDEGVTVGTAVTGFVPGPEAVGAAVEVATVDEVRE
jgi:hypothetical protein